MYDIDAPRCGIGVMIQHSLCNLGAAIFESLLTF